MPAFPAEHGQKEERGKKKGEENGESPVLFYRILCLRTSCNSCNNGGRVLGTRRDSLPLRFTEKKLVSRSRASRSSVVSVSRPEYTKHCRLDGPPFGGGRFFFSPPWLKLLQPEAVLTNLTTAKCRGKRLESNLHRVRRGEGVPRSIRLSVVWFPILRILLTEGGYYRGRFYAMAQLACRIATLAFHPP